jgi:2-polyprenyl-3-methyl-5-hydroxy-6-metoxy-1,4-benzoquinol methylase
MYVYPDDARADILRMIPPDGSVIGSVGCGYAATEAELVRAGRIVYGVDVAPEVERIAAGRLTKFQLIRPGDDLPWDAATLDGLLLADVIEHIPMAWNALADWSRCVRPGGWVVISVPNMRTFPVMGRFILTGDWPERDQGIFDRTHLQVMSERRLFRWCAAAGLEVVKVFDSYNGSRMRRKFFRALDICTFRLLRSWNMYQIQCVCRRANGPVRGESPPPESKRAI